MTTKQKILELADEMNKLRHEMAGAVAVSIIEALESGVEIRDIFEQVAIKKPGCKITSHRLVNREVIQHPTIAGVSWNGRGRKPAWVISMESEPETEQPT